jgi:non-specific serine/threonine protein kinase
VPAVEGQDQRGALAPLDADIANFRAAIAHAIARGDRPLALRMAIALWTYWFARGQFREGAAWTERALALRGEAPLDDRLWALNIASNLHYLSGEYERSVAAAQALLDLARSEGHGLGEAMGFMQLSFVPGAQGDHETAVAWAEGALARFRAMGCRGWIPWAAERAGLERLRRGDLDRAEMLFRESLNRFLELGNEGGTTHALSDLGLALQAKGDLAGAEVLFRGALRREAALGLDWRIADSLLALADIATARGQVRRAALLLGAGDALLDRLGIARTGWLCPAHDRAASGARQALGNEAFHAIWNQGRVLPLSDVVAVALGVDDAEEPAASPPAGATARQAELTPRELEVLRQVAAGRSNREIAEALFISVPTVKRHLTNILAKLALPSRSAATAYAHTHDLVGASMADFIR